MNGKLNWIEKLFEEYLMNRLLPKDNDLALKFVIWEGELDRCWSSGIAALTF